MQRFGDRRDWFLEKRFGLFVHWGLYAIHGWHEQEQFRRGMTRAQYTPLIHEFNPTKYDPEAWLDLAEEAGMEYVCFTTKHVDGFCMWDTAQTPYRVTNTPYGRDVLAMLAEACERRGFPLCLYYSVADMNQPSYPSAGRSYELPAPEAGDTPDLKPYLDFVREQVRELCTQYGPIGGFWWDANVIGHRDPSFNAMIRELQPGAVINNRGFDDGDFGTPEREWEQEVYDAPTLARLTEACQSVGVESWGYREDEDYYALRHLLAGLDRALAKGGNYLLNVGPMPDGTMPEEGAAILRRIGRWYERAREALIGVEPCPQLTENREVLLTRNGDSIYVHLYRPPMAESVVLAPMDRLPKQAVLLNTGREVEARIDLLPSRHDEGKPCLRLRDLPVDELAGEVLVVRMEF